MKALGLMLSIAVLASCSRTDHPEAAQPLPESGAASKTTEMSQKAITALANGTIESVDISAKKVTITHGPIASVNWPAMTMTFDAPNVDLGSVKVGDHVVFELAVNGMHGQVTKIERR